MRQTLRPAPNVCEGAPIQASSSIIYKRAFKLNHTEPKYQSFNMTHQKQHLHNPTGITDEVAVEGHDLIHNAEMEEQKVSWRDTTMS